MAAAFSRFLLGPLCVLGLLVFAGCAGRRAAAQIPAPAAPAEEFRAFWVDAFHAGIRTPQEAAQLVADAKRANMNALIVQVRRRGDAFYRHSFEPPAEDPAYDPNFDALAHIIELAHREGLEVHAWVNAMPVWRPSVPPPAAANHVFNLHGLGRTGDDNWLTATPEGDERFPVGYFLDPGHPAAAAHTAEVYLNIVRHYTVDGIHFDFIRYPETTEKLPRGAPVGYNARSLARFRRATGRQDTPAPDDPQWTDWRREQVTQLVRRVYLEAKAINPHVKVSAALIPWGKPPAGEKDFEEASPAQRVFQDWHSWLKEGILDLAIPMNYARETDAVTRGWFDGWIRWEKRHKHGRQLAVGIGAYLNPPQATLKQVRRVRRAEGSHRAEGLAFFSYANPFPAPPSRDASPSANPQREPKPVDPEERVAFFSLGATPQAPAFPQPAAIPKMDWLEQPTRGWLAGTVRDASGNPADGARVRVRRTGWSPFRRTLHAVADGNGFFGLTNLRPGRYRVWREVAPGRVSETTVEVNAGRVTRVELVPQ